MTRERLIRLVGQITATPVGDAAGWERPLSELGITSLKMVNLIFAIEVEFDVAIPQAEITPANFDSLAALEALLARLSAETATG
jgi:acyl carrier protein